MAQWYELTIPAAATLLGGFTGAWFQSRTTERQMKLQADEARATRQDTAAREERQRLFTERAQERERFFAQRRQAYAALGEAGYALTTVAKELVEAEGAMDALERKASAWLGAKHERAKRAKERLTSASAKYDAARQAFRVALVAVEVVGTEPAARLAREMAGEQRTIVRHPTSSEVGSGYIFARLDDLRDRFLDQARQDIEPAGDREATPTAEPTHEVASTAEGRRGAKSLPQARKRRGI